MSEEREPLRLADDPSEAAELRAALAAARAEPADGAMLDRVLAGVLAGGGGGGGTGGSGGGAAAGKIAAAIGAGAIGVGAVAWMMSGAAVEPAAPPRLPPAVIAYDAFVAADAYVEPDAGPADAGVDAFVVAARLDRRPVPPTSALESDGALLLRATREHDAAASLALLREHASRFPASPSAEDREALIVIDLARLHRETEAERGAEAFRARWPRSAHLPHIDAELARMSPR